MKFDRQIVAIAKANSAAAIYSDDAGLVALAKDEKLKTISVADLEIPPEMAQTDWLKQADEKAVNRQSED